MEQIDHIPHCHRLFIHWTVFTTLLAPHVFHTATGSVSPLPNPLTQDGRTPLHNAYEKNHLAVMDVLIDKHGANVEAVDKVRPGGV